MTNAGQEILFDELEDLKNNVNLGKKNFRQLALGKLLEMVSSSIIDKTIGNEIYKELSSGFKNFKGILK